VALQHYGERDASAVAALTAAGAVVVEVPVYRYRRPVEDARARGLIDAACNGQVDAVTFTSAPSVRNLLSLAEEHGRRRELLTAFNEREVAVACVGPVCAEAAQDAGVERPVAPGQGRLGLLVRTVTDVLQARRQDLRCGSVPFVVQGRAVAVEGRVVDLPPRERAVLDLLLRRRGAVVSKTAILRSLGGDPAAGHALEATITRLRRHLGVAGASIRVIRGRGYCLDAEEQSTSVPQGC
jgi:uroporphyrinogen-III synthase